MLTGADLDELRDEALWQAAEWTHLFVEVHPNQVSPVFDYLAFSTLLFVLRATADQFRTGWFLESVYRRVPL